MSLAHSNSALDKALELISAEGPCSSAYLCAKVLALINADESMAERLARAMLDKDPRFARTADRLWALASDTQSAAQALLSASYVVIDVETTGFAPPADRVIEIGMVRVEGGRITDSYESLVNPRRPVPGPISSLTGISCSMLESQPTFDQICAEVVGFLGDSVFVAHNAPFDWRFVQNEVVLSRGKKMLNPRLCTRILARRLVPELNRRSLDELALFFNLSFSARHRALGDAEVTARLLLRLLDRAGERGIETLGGLFELAAPQTGRKA
ncbi:MAG: 3'-5' exonuclease [Candidatus Glassbacteria bacterium]|nr:3'-5' exonuclease [Candidatus Glassbacteria bacterium]